MNHAFPRLAFVALTSAVAVGCQKPTQTPTPAAPATAPVADPVEVPATSGVALRYGKTASPLEGRVEAEFHGSQYYGDIEGNVACEVKVEIDDADEGVELHWEVVSADSDKSTSPWGDVAELVGATGVLAMGTRGEGPSYAPMSKPPPKGATKQFERMYKTLGAALTPPTLPDTRLVVGEAFTLRREDTAAIGDAKVPIEVEIAYELLAVDSADGVELATLHIRGTANGEAEFEGLDTKVEQTTEGKLVIGVEDGVPRSFEIEHEQSIRYDEEATEYSFAVNVSFVDG